MSIACAATVAALAGAARADGVAAAAEPSLSPARAHLRAEAALRRAKAPPPTPVISDEARAAVAALRGAGTAFGRALTAVSRADELVPVTLHAANFRRTRTFLIPEDGELGDAQAEDLERLLRCRRTGRRHAVSAGLLRIVADLGRTYPGRVIEVVSGYRTPPNGAPNSKHFHGHALDLRVRGVPVKNVRNHLWKEHRSIGLGYYRAQKFLHIDYRPGEPDIAWTSPRRGAPYRYHPRWARRAREDRERTSRVGL